MFNESFITKDEPLVWADVLQNNSFTKDEFNDIHGYAMDYVAKGRKDFNPEVELKRIKIHQANRANLVSPLWRYWGADHSVKTTVDFDYSSSLEMQRLGCKDKQRKITDTEEQAFPASLMCCDTPERTIGFLSATFAKQQKMTLGERLAFLAELSAYVNLQMQIAFIIKWIGRFPRPSDVVSQKVDSVKEFGRISIIPHPNHPSLSSGHSTVGQAVKKFVNAKYSNVSEDFNQLCDEVGLARITAGIHWFADHQAAIDSVERYHELVMSKI